MAEPNSKYTQVISSAISNFNAIWAALKDKKVTRTVDNVLTVINDDMVVPVTEYSGLIGQLTRLKHADGTHYTLAGNEARAYLANETVNSTGNTHTVTYDSDNSNYAVSTNVGAVGFYEAGAKLASTLSAQTISLSGTLEAIQTDHYDITESTTTFTVVPDDQVIGAVNIAKGKATIKIAADDLTHDLSAAGVTSITNRAGIGADEVIESTTAPGSGYVSVTVSTVMGVAGTVTSKLSSDNVSLTKGYVNSIEFADSSDNAVAEYSQTKTLTFNKDAASGNTTVNKTLYIKEASVSGITGSGVASATFHNDLGALTESSFGTGSTLSTDDYYEITASATIAIDTENATINPGYISASTNLAIDTENTAITGAKYYIKKGSVKTAADHDIAVTLQKGAITQKNSASRDAGYKIAVSLAEASQGAKTLGIDSGFITSSTVPYQLSGGAIDVELDRSTVTVAPTNFKATVNNGYNSNVFKTGSGDYAITVTPEITLTADSITAAAGYLADKTDVTISSFTATPVTMYVDNAVGTLSTEITATYVNKNTTDGKTDGKITVEGEEVESKVTIFSATEPTDRDHYVINATSAFNLTKGGYIGSTVEDTVGDTLYIPRATFKYVEDSAVGNFLQVEHGGYIPSGAITSIAEVTGEIDYAAIQVGASASTAANAASILSTTGTDGTDYKLTIVKNGNSDAGYISGAANQGSVALESNYYIKKTTASVTNTIADGDAGVKLNAFTWDATNSKYVSTIDVASTSTLDLAGAGYITTAELSGKNTAANGTQTSGSLSANTYTITTNKTRSVELAKAVLAIDSTNNTISLKKHSNTTVATADAATGYAVVVELNDATIGVKADTSGYIDASSGAQNITVGLDGTTYTTHIQAGTKLETVANTATASVNLTGAWDGTANAYKFTSQTPTIAVSGTLEEGYYAGDNLAVSGTATITATATQIAGATAKMSASGTTSIDSATGATLYSDDEKVSGKSYIEIVPTATAAVSASSVGVGYLNSTSQITPTVDGNAYALTATSSFIEKFAGTGSTGARSELAEYVKDGVEIDHIHTGEQAVYKVTVGSRSFIDTGRTAADIVRTEAILTEEKYVNKDIEITLHADAMGSNVYNEIAALEARLLGVLSTSAS